MQAPLLRPDEIPPENRNRLLIHVHGGCHVLFPGEAGATAAIPMAGLEHFKVISVDCRMPPEAYFPAAVDDVLTVYKARTTDPKNIGTFGASAGGGPDLGSDTSREREGRGVARRHFSRHADVGRDTVRSHRALRAAGVAAQLEVYEGQSHAQKMFDDRLPETAAFFDKHLGK